jgi:hypothetical protein
MVVVRGRRVRWLSTPAGRPQQPDPEGQGQAVSLEQLQTWLPFAFGGWQTQ